jgi:hypothetical protein
MASTQSSNNARLLRALPAILALAVIVHISVVAGPVMAQDAVSKAEKVDGELRLLEAKAIAEEGFIYGLPTVMNYAVMYEYAVDRNSGQFKAPFNQINNEARVFTYKDTAVITPNSDTPYSILFMDLRAEPLVLSVPAVEKSRYYSVMFCDGNTFTTVTSVAGPQAVKPATTWWSDPTGRARLLLAAGQPLDGSKHNYTITFAPGAFPPVDAFWSVTMYDGKTQLLIENPINRYLINSPMLPSMKTNADGSLTIFIQNAAPSSEKAANWLPAPNGPIYLVMRLYWPKTTPPSILPPGEGTWQPPGIKSAS